MIMGKLFDPFRVVLLWLSSKPNRLRIRGARIEVMAFLVTRVPELSILLGKSVYHDIWMPPQEGVQLNESFHEALHRCLEIECGLDLPPDPKLLARHMYFRSFRFMGMVPLPPDRHGERPVADDAPGTPFESVKLTRKAYWMATVLLGSQTDIDPRADGRELIDLQWFSVADAKEAIRKTNHAEKAKLLLRALDTCHRDLRGGPRPNLE